LITPETTPTLIPTNPATAPELKRGKVADLFKLAKVIEGLVPATLAFKSKSERGYDLLEDTIGHSGPTEQIELESAMNIGRAFQTIGRSILRHVVDNEPAVRKGDSEGVHQMRVGLRKLRAAISIFSELLNDRQTQFIKGELVWMTNELGPARDLDVYLKTTVEPLEKVRARKRGLREFADDLLTRRKAAFKKLKNAVNSPRYRLLILGTLQWIEAGDWLKHSGACAKRPVGRFTLVDCGLVEGIVGVFDALLVHVARNREGSLVLAHGSQFRIYGGCWPLPADGLL
jgi:inorganic triphosphatase YgiF